MQGLIALIGVLSGGLVTILGQYFLRLADKRTAFVDFVLEQCAQLIALEEDLRNRVWEERALGLGGRVSEWPLSEYLVAEARLKIACRDRGLHDALQDIQLAGRALSTAWRGDERDEEAVEAMWRQHREALDRLIAVSGALLERAGDARRRRSLYSSPPHRLHSS
jgi:hypothetical protein